MAVQEAVRNRRGGSPGVDCHLQPCVALELRLQLGGAQQRHERLRLRGLLELRRAPQGRSTGSRRPREGRS
eukprot:3211015-Alexandrium_andersonii.AAC.1